MTYTPVPAVIAGDTIDEVFIMTYWVDNMAAQAPDVFSAKGQMIIGTGLDTMGVLAPSTNGMLLTLDSAQALGVKWSHYYPRKTIVTKSADQTGLVSPVNVTWDAEVADDEGLHSNSVNNSRITIVSNGLYFIDANVYNNSSHNFDIKKNGSTVLGRGTLQGYSARLRQYAALLAGDYIEIYFNIASGGPFTVSKDYSYFSVTRLGD